MERRNLGGLEVAALGLGCMGMSAHYGPADERVAIATIRRAGELGCNFLDTAELYGPFTNEDLIGRAISGRRARFVVGTKWGALPGRLDGSAQRARRSLEGSLTRLRTDYLDIYYLTRVDPRTPIEESVGAMAELVAEGKVRHVGLCEVSAATLRRAHAVHPISAVQTEYSLWSRDVERGVLPACRELNIGFVAYAPLGRGFLAGRFDTADELHSSDARRVMPRYGGADVSENLRLRAVLEQAAGRKRCTPAQLALAWLLGQGSDIVPIPGTRQRSRLEENLGALTLHCSREELRELSATLPLAAGERYHAAGMAVIDQ